MYKLFDKLQFYVAPDVVFNERLNLDGLRKSSTGKFYLLKLRT
jgi:hypothetical protein